MAKPDAILGWYRKLIERKFDGSRHRCYPGRPRIAPELEALVVRIARKNSGWGYDRIVGALANLGHRISDQTVGNIPRRHAWRRRPNGAKTQLGAFIRSHMAVLAGIGFFTVELLTWRVW